MRSLTYLDRWRVSDAGDEFNGAFKLRIRPTTTRVWVIASNGLGWDHVSVSIADAQRLPTWDEMVYIRRLFFHDEEAVMQLHPPTALNVSNAEVLHLWRPQHDDIPMPPPLMVGIPGVTSADIDRALRLRRVR